MYRSDGDDSLAWQGEFFLTDPEPAEHLLLLETMQIDQPANWVTINGNRVGRLEPRARPDPTSTWVTQQIPVDRHRLRQGVNVIEIEVGYRNPVRQYGWWRHENLQVRNIRLIPSADEAVAAKFEWQALGAPGGWGEVIRLRPMVDDSGALRQLWVTINRDGGLWRADVGDGSTSLNFVNWSGELSDTLILDILAAGNGYLAATERGIFFRRSAGASWVMAPGFPEGYVHFVAAVDDIVYAGVEGQGLWQSALSGGQWESAGLEERTPLDMVTNDSGVCLRHDGRRGVCAFGSGLGPASGFSCCCVSRASWACGRRFLCASVLGCGRRPHRDESGPSLGMERRAWMVGIRS